MSKPWVHAESSARKFGGKPEDYIDLHNLMDSSKGTIADSRHRALTHNSWFIAPDGPLERIFGVNLTNSDGRLVSVRELGEQHILEDFGNRFIPSAQDYLQEINVQEWMVQGKGAPPSFALIFKKTKEAIKRTVTSWKEGFPAGVITDPPIPPSTVGPAPCGEIPLSEQPKECTLTFSEESAKEYFRQMDNRKFYVSGSKAPESPSTEDEFFIDGATEARNKFLID